jgi:myosin heavy subunit
MLETVRIRQAGYNVRFTYDEFIQLYRILLPKGLLRYLKTPTIIFDRRFMIKFGAVLKMT